MHNFYQLFNNLDAFKFPDCGFSIVFLCENHSFGQIKKMVSFIGKLYW